MSPRQRLLVLALTREPGSTVAELAPYVGSTARKTRTSLRRLRDRGLVRYERGSWFLVAP